MSEYLVILKADSVDKLREKLSKNLARYEKSDPDWPSYFDSDDYSRQTRIKISNGNLSKCFGAEDYSRIGTEILKNEPARCENIYKALEGLTPQQATDERIWAYLTHFVFWDYTCARWPLPKEKEKKEKGIRAHFFIEGLRGMVRDNAISRLWWMAHVCSRVKGHPLKEVLSALLYKEDARKEIMERASFCRSDIIFNSLMKFVLRSFNGNKKLHDRGTFRDLCKYLNRVGGVRVLDSLGADKLDDMIEKIISDELKIDPKFPKKSS